MTETAITNEDDLRRLGWKVLPDDGFIGLVGPFWRGPDLSAHRYGFLAQAKHKNRVGVVQGGMLMTFADRCMGSAARNADPAVVQATIQMSYDFIDPGRIGDFIEIECEVMRRTRSLIFMRGVITGAGRLIGSASGIWKLKT